MSIWTLIHRRYLHHGNFFNCTNSINLTKSNRTLYTINGTNIKNINNINKIHKRWFASVDSSKDYYKILGVSQSASKEDIKDAFRKLTKEWHPDLHATKPEKERAKIRAKFQEINEAYETLSNDDLRRKYDDFRRYGQSPFGNPNHQGFTYKLCLFCFGLFSCFLTYYILHVICYVHILQTKIY